MIYSAFEEIPVQDITISFVVTPKPTKLFAHLEHDRSFMISEVRPGIYYIEGDTFPIQVIESKKLTADENVFLKSLRSNLTPVDMRDVFEAYSKYGELEKVSAYLNRILEANDAVLEEVLAMSDKVKEIVMKHLENTGESNKFVEQGQEQAKRETALEMLNDGFSPDKIARYVQKPLEWVQGLA